MYLIALYKSSYDDNNLLLQLSDGTSGVLLDFLAVVNWPMYLAFDTSAECIGWAADPAVGTN